jgi:hypothetical protein
MNKRGLCAIVVACCLSAAAQVTVEVTLPQEQFLPGESLVAAVRIINRSGQTLQLGETADWLTFSVESRDNLVISRSGEPPVQGAFSLGSSQRATKRVDLAPYFALTQPGRYSIVANVHIGEWNRDVTSVARGFDVINGSKLWEQEFGVPGTSTGAGVPEVRKFILQQANHVKGEIRLYLRLTDASETKAFRVERLGTLMSFSRPEHQVDRSSNLHVLFATGPRTYLYFEFGPEGTLVNRETYDYVDSRPRLKGDEEGKISVAGGLRRNPATTDPASQSDDVSAPKS